MKEMTPGSLAIVDDIGAVWAWFSEFNNVRYAQIQKGEIVIIVGRLLNEYIPRWKTLNGFFYYVVVTRLGILFSSDEKISLLEEYDGI